MATESTASLVLVDTRLVSQEVFIDCEGSGDRSILLNVSLDGINGVEAVAGGGEVLVTLVSEAVIIDALLGASGRNLFDIIARGERLAGDVVSALLHSVVVAGA